MHEDGRVVSRGTIGAMNDGVVRPAVKLRFDAQHIAARCSMCQHETSLVVRVSVADRKSNYALICFACVQGMADARSGAAS